MTEVPPETWIVAGGPFPRERTPQRVPEPAPGGSARAGWVTAQLSAGSPPRQTRSGL